MVHFFAPELRAGRVAYCPYKWTRDVGVCSPGDGKSDIDRTTFFCCNCIWFIELAVRRRKGDGQCMKETEETTGD